MSLTVNNHLAWRAGFGPALGEWEAGGKDQPHQYFSALQKASAAAPAYLKVASNPLEGMNLQMPGAFQNLSQEQRKKLRQQNREDIQALNLAWLDQMVVSPAQLREKMAFFWHGHFACRSQSAFFQQELLQVIRTHALGNFRDLLRAVSKSAAMINFLNNNQNRKGRPNENFARELMELFTIGKGHYTEQDIREAARAFTGWGADPAGNFVFRRQQHDFGVKQFLGKSGDFTGDDILEILLEQPATARFICSRIYRFFVNEQVDTEQVHKLADRFFQSGYNIGALMADIFSAGFFYHPTNMGNRIKSPVELWVGMRRQLPLQAGNQLFPLQLQRLLGQVLFFPPNVAGWPGGRNWIDGNSLLLRMRLASVASAGGGFNLRPKQDDDQQMGMAAPDNQGRQTGISIGWEKYTAAFERVKRDQLYMTLSRFLLQSGMAPPEGVLLKHADAGSREAFIRSLTLQLMGCPEYQLC